LWIVDPAEIGGISVAHGNVIPALMPLVITDAQLERRLASMADGLAALNT